MDTYLRQCARGLKGGKLPKNFEQHLAKWLQDLNREESISPHQKRYWTIPAYALAHKMHPKTLCKRFREMENIAKDLFPHRVPANRTRGPLSEQEKQAIRRRYLAGEDGSALAEEFRISSARVGLLCRQEKEIRDDERLRRMDAPNAPTEAPSSGDPEIPF